MISSEDEDEEQDFTNVTNDRTDAKVYSDKKETAKCSSFQPEEELSVQIIPEIICENSVKSQNDTKVVEPLISIKANNRIKSNIS